MTAEIDCIEVVDILCISGSSQHRSGQSSETDSIVACDLTGSRSSRWTSCAQRLAMHLHQNKLNKVLYFCLKARCQLVIVI